MSKSKINKFSSKNSEVSSIQQLKFEKTTLRETIAEKMEHMILENQLEVGSKLPSEIELADLFGVSRNILRESLNILKERGIISGKSGDGTYVVRPEPIILTQMLSRLVKLSDLSYKNIFDLRLAIEVLAAGLAAENATEDDFEQMDHLIDQMKDYIDKDIDKYSETIFLFHKAIATASKNMLLPSIMEPLHNILLEIFTEGYTEEHNKQIDIVQDHKKIVDKLRERDKAGVEILIAEHIKYSRRKVIK